MATVFIFHGIGGHPGENWFPWLKEQLELRGYRVIVPSFPNADRPDLSEWLRHFSKYKKEVCSDTIFVGHSLGGSLAMHILERLSTPIAKTLLVASVSGETGSTVDPYILSFTITDYDWENIRKHGGKISIIHSNNDPYILLEQAKDLARELQTTVSIIYGGGHLNEAAGFRNFPALLNLITK